MPGTALRGTVQNDILKEYIARGNYIFPPRPSMRITTDLFAYCAERLPRWNTISISGYHIREAGLDGRPGARVHARERHRLLRRRGRRRALAGRLRRARSFFFNAHNDFFQEVAKFRAARRLWAQDDERALRRDQPESARAPLPRADRRLDAHRAAAREQHRARGGAGALGRLRRRPVAAHELRSTRRSRCPPSTRRGSLSARSRCSSTRPATTRRPTRSAGSYYIEALTYELEQRASELIARVDELGGAVAAIEQGFVQRRDRGRRVPRTRSRSSQGSA